MRKSETYRNEIKSYIVRTGMTMTEVVDYLSDEYGWSRSVPNLSGKLKRGSLRYLQTRWGMTSCGRRENENVSLICNTNNKPFISRLEKFCAI